MRKRTRVARRLGALVVLALAVVGALARPAAADIEQICVEWFDGDHSEPIVCVPVP